MGLGRSSAIHTTAAVGFRNFRIQVDFFLNFIQRSVLCQTLGFLLFNAFKRACKFLTAKNASLFRYRGAGIFVRECPSFQVRIPSASVSVNFKLETPSRRPVKRKRYGWSQMGATAAWIPLLWHQQLHHQLEVGVARLVVRPPR